jgi:hypothetical protein
MSTAKSAVKALAVTLSLLHNLSIHSALHIGHTGLHVLQADIMQKKTQLSNVVSRKK